MTQEQYLKMCDFMYMGGGLIPHNENAKEYISGLKKGEIISFIPAKRRDIRLHKSYFSLLKFYPKKLINQ